MNNREFTKYIMRQYHDKVETIIDNCGSKEEGDMVQRKLSEFVNEVSSTDNISFDENKMTKIIDYLLLEYFYI